jgi:hypothetical protein
MQLSVTLQVLLDGYKRLQHQEMGGRKRRTLALVDGLERKESKDF